MNSVEELIKYGIVCRRHSSTTSPEDGVTRLVLLLKVHPNDVSRNGKRSSSSLGSCTFYEASLVVCYIVEFNSRSYDEKAFGSVSTFDKSYLTLLLEETKLLLYIEAITPRIIERNGAFGEGQNNV